MRWRHAGCSRRALLLAIKSTRRTPRGVSIGHSVGRVDAWPTHWSTDWRRSAVLILALTDGASLPEALNAAKAILRAEPSHEETLRAIELAEELVVSGLPHEEAVSWLGEGWVAEEALAISLYCSLVARNFREGVILAVNQDGDSHSTGAITGNLLGAMLGANTLDSELE